ncbi:hypothetical protein, partial [Achromobacter ruhlandii]|uniref:hypothetical protein n=1 Tax=Achromobacter ruhlandii TaxID=72557 RepID=UPI001C12AE38
MAYLQSSWRRIATNCRQLSKNRTAILLTLLGGVLALSARPVITDALRQKMHFALDVQVEENRCLPHTFYSASRGRPEGEPRRGMEWGYRPHAGCVRRAVERETLCTLLAA